MRVSILCSNLATNCLWRGYLLAKVLSRHYQVEIVGPAPGGRIWPPCDTGEFEIKPFPAVPSASWTYLRGIVRSIDADVVYALKPLLASYGLGLAKRAVARTPVVVDIDDWQLAFKTPMAGWLDVKRIRARLGAFGKSANSYYWVYLLDRLVRRADGITTTSSFLNAKYGNRAVIVPHGRDTALFSPDRYDAKALRREAGLDGFRIIMFLGTARPHKGIEDLIAAVRASRRHDVRIVIAGLQDRPDFTRRLCAENDDLVTTLGMVPFNEVPRFLSLADLVVLPQKAEAKTLGQIPAKLVDAMAMARPIIASGMADIGDILEGCGVVVEPGDVPTLAREIDRLLSDDAVARDLGRRAREKCMQEYSFEVMERQLLKAFARYAA